MGTENINKVAISNPLITQAKDSNYLPVLEVNVSLIKKSWIITQMYAAKEAITYIPSVKDTIYN